MKVTISVWNGWFAQSKSIQAKTPRRSRGRAGARPQRSGGLRSGAVATRMAVADTSRGSGCGAPSLARMRPALQAASRPCGSGAARSR